MADSENEQKDGEKPSGAEVFGSLVTAAIGAVAVYKAAQATAGLAVLGLRAYVHYKAEEARRSLEQEEAEDGADLGERLDRADALLATEDSISADVAAMLLAATVEAGLRKLANRHDIAPDDDTTDGIAAWAEALRDADVISREHYQSLHRRVITVRNCVMHGDFDGFSVEDVQSLAEFAREFFDAHDLLAS